MAGKQSGQTGFTLIEVMITVAIVAILAAIALPSYQDYVRRGNIPEATSELSARRTALEQWFQDNRDYSAAGGPCAAAWSTKNFDFTCPTLTATTYQITATGKAGGLMSAFSYTIDQGVTVPNVLTRASTTYFGDSTNCWVTRKGGLC
jgi:type IV pilus assembly protein PilE